MSILLDALRKSEEQRRLGSTPSIHSGPEGQTAGGDSAQQWIPLSLIALSAIAMAWIGWQQFQRPAGMTGPEAVANAGSQQSMAADGDRAAPRDEQDPDGSASGAGQGVPEDSRLAPRTPVETYAQTNETPQANADRAAAPAAARQGGAQESFQAYDSETEPGGDEGLQGEPGTETEMPQIALEPPPSGRSDPESAAGSPAARSQPPANEPITYWELPQGVRDSLPELRITVLVYADQPEDRFLLVSGQRLVEQDEFEGGVVLDEIRRDGAVFLYRKYRFLVKG